MGIRIGVLALQGDYAAHQKMLEEQIGVETVAVRTSEELGFVDGLILPGGESTTIGKMLDRYGLGKQIVERASDGLPIYGTCAGMILMAKRIVGSEQMRLGILDATVARNAFGRQIDSFEADIDAPGLGTEPIRGVFIRAPYVTEIGTGVVVLAAYEGRIVAVEQGNLLASAFHPEITDDTRMHRYFLEKVAKSGQIEKTL